MCTQHNVTHKHTVCLYMDSESFQAVVWCACMLVVVAYLDFQLLIYINVTISTLSYDFHLKHTLYIHFTLHISTLLSLFLSVYLIIYILSMELMQTPQQTTKNAQYSTAAFNRQQSEYVSMIIPLQSARLFNNKSSIGTSVASVGTNYARTPDFNMPFSTSRKNMHPSEIANHIIEGEQVKGASMNTLVRNYFSQQNLIDKQQPVKMASHNQLPPLITTVKQKKELQMQQKCHIVLIEGNKVNISPFNKMRERLSNPNSSTNNVLKNAGFIKRGNPSVANNGQYFNQPNFKNGGSQSSPTPHKRTLKFVSTQNQTPVNHKLAQNQIFETNKAQDTEDILKSRRLDVITTFRNNNHTAANSLMQNKSPINYQGFKSPNIQVNSVEIQNQMDQNNMPPKLKKEELNEEVKRRFYERLTELIEYKNASRQNLPGTQTSSIERLKNAIARTKGGNKGSGGTTEIKIEDSTALSSRMMDYPIQPLQIMVKNNIGGSALNQDLDQVGSSTVTPNSRNMIDYAQLPRLKTLTNHHNNSSAIIPETILNAVDSQDKNPFLSKFLHSLVDHSAQQKVQSSKTTTLKHSSMLTSPNPNSEQQDPILAPRFKAIVRDDSLHVFSKDYIDLDTGGLINQRILIPTPQHAQTQKQFQTQTSHNQSQQNLQKRHPEIKIAPPIGKNNCGSQTLRTFFAPGQNQAKIHHESLSLSSSDQKKKEAKVFKVRNKIHQAQTVQEHSSSSIEDANIIRPKNKIICTGGGVGNRYLINLRQNSKYQYNWQIHLQNKHQQELLGELSQPSPLGIVQLSPPSEKLNNAIVVKKKKEVVWMNNRSKEPQQNNNQACLDLEDDYFDEEMSQAGVYNQVGISKYNVSTPSSVNTLRVNQQGQSQ